ncbi:exo-beta-N-acetylmuramidase NamZ domain-containing protein [Dysgonomonas sp. ZJ279]|uniref:exo-beta-N-acetylmuramidase NamZ family protein n=1 Tax=Dysgonomonas sp. ZJ279 TaxID=2709796 RepID=UPI0013EB86A4|nr:DUF1343 domain-containing protein [Dysgonomonas sp. ZJ279]
MKRVSILLFLIISLTSYAQNEGVVMGAESTNEYFPLIQNKRIAVISNHTGMVGDEHLVDMLVREKHNVTAIFSPEHGFRGDADAGEHVSSSVDEKTGIAIRSLYDGIAGKPSKESMQLFDVLVFDIQDVGLRFYTYYITMVKLMDACAEYNKKMIILDRPNPNGHYVDGPILDMKHKSGVGWLPIPVVHGMTLGELALMTNGEGWLPSSRKCDITVVKCKNYSHQTLYQLPLAPSPNLPNMKSIYLYPSTCLFEGTPVSLGRGTTFPFQVYGHPNMKGYTFTFTPKSIPGAKNPPLLNKLCYGVDLRNVSNEEIFENKFDLSYVIDAYNNLKMGDKFFQPFFEKLVGVDYIRKMIIAGKSADEIKLMWKDDVAKFKKQRTPYLLYHE